MNCDTCAARLEAEESIITGKCSSCRSRNALQYEQIMRQRTLYLNSFAKSPPPRVVPNPVEKPALPKPPNCKACKGVRAMTASLWCGSCSRTRLQLESGPGMRDGTGRGYTEPGETVLALDADWNEAW